MMKYWATTATAASFQLVEPHNTEGQSNTSKKLRLQCAFTVLLYLYCVFAGIVLSVFSLNFCIFVFVLCLYWRAIEDIKKYRLQCIWSHFPMQFGADNERGKCGRWQDLVSGMFYLQKQNWMLHFPLKECVEILKDTIIPKNHMDHGKEVSRRA